MFDMFELHVQVCLKFLRFMSGAGGSGDCRRNRGCDRHFAVFTKRQGFVCSSVMRGIMSTFVFLEMLRDEHL